MDPIEISALSLRNDMIKLDTLSNNIANLTTPAYKKTVAYTESFTTMLDRLQESVDPNSIAVNGLATPAVKMISDHRLAALKHSGNPLDIALEGDAFFELQDPTGSLFTKRGNFSLDSRGRIVLSGTNAVLSGVSGDIRVSSAPEIDLLGRIFENGRQIGQLKLVQFDDPAQLKPLAGGLFAAEGLRAQELSDAPIVRQGYLENSNTEPAAEMIALVQLARHVEATQQVIRGYDGMLETVLDDLGNF